MTDRLEFHPAANEFPLLSERDPKRFAEMVEDIRANGLSEDIVTHEGKILDGRNRYLACLEAGVEPRFIAFIGGDPYRKVWSLNGERRDLTSEQRYLIWKSVTAQSDEWQAEQNRIQQQANARRSEATRQQHQVSNPRAGEKLDSGSPTGSGTTKRDHTAKHAASSSTARATASGTNRGAVERMDELDRKRPDLAEKVKSGEVSAGRAFKELKEEERRLKFAERVAAEPDGLYDVIVIDPPWPMEKIEREVRPNQVALDYPTMTEEEIRTISLPAADDCHIWVWTTHKFLPMALRCIEAWGARYVCTFVWHKPGGFQPIGLPQYNCEFALYCRIGSPHFVDTKAFNTAFNAPRGAHSEKPEAFYETVRRVTDGRRLDMFNRREIEGFDSWGNESARLAS